MKVLIVSVWAATQINNKFVFTEWERNTKIVLMGE